MRVLGISCFYHDSAAAIIVDGQIVAAAEEERFSRVKHDFAFPKLAIQFCLDSAFCKAEDLDLVVFFEKPFQKFDRLLMSSMASWPKSAVAFRESSLVWLLDKLWVQAFLQEQLGVAKDKIVFCSHHLSHAASAYYCSGFTSAALLTVDGVGEWATGTRGSAWGNQIHLDDEMRFPHSLGLLYSAFTAFLGFQVNEGEYKVMGMAPYGKPTFFDTIFKNLVRLDSDGSFTLNMDYFAFHRSAYHSFSDKFCDLFGRPRTPEESNLLDPHYANIAASIQAAAEEILVRQAQALHRKYGHENLCLAGGVALNSVANARIYRESGFSNLYIHPAAGDNGGALGAALWGYYNVLGGTQRYRLLTPYLGQEHDDYAVADYLRSQNCKFRELPDMNSVYQEISARLESGQVVGWMKGRFEWGPRALGARSILADPRSAYMKDLVNARIKFREPFRPFAPSVLAEGVESYFDISNSHLLDPLRFMLMVVPVRPEMREVIPAVTHVDGTSRIQAVYQQESPYYYELIKAFYQRTGVPLVLNTSFNLRGEPIVNTPAEALSTFTRSDMDALIMGRMLVSRRAISDKRVIPGAELEKWSHTPSLAENQNAQGRAAASRKIVYKSDNDSSSGFTRIISTAFKYVAIIFLLLVGAEILVRLGIDNTNMQMRGLYISTKDGLRMQPGWTRRIHGPEFSAEVHINDEGWRAMPALRPVDQFGGDQVKQLADGADDKAVSEAVASRRPGVGQTILALGDSFTFGCWSDAEDTWLNQIQCITGAKVLNYGIPNAGTDAEAELYAKLKPSERKADVVMLGFYTGNDFYDNMVGSQSFTVSDKALVLTPKAEALWSNYDCFKKQQDSVDLPKDNNISLYKNLLRRSHLYQFLCAIAYSFGGSAKLRPNTAQAWCLNSYTKEMREGAAKTAESLEKIRTLCSERGSVFVIVLIPSSIEVYDQDWQNWIERSKLEDSLFDRGKPRQIVLDWAADQGVYVLDLWPYLVNRPRMYYSKDMHFNKLGHFQTGEVVSQFLDRAGIFDINMYDSSVVDSNILPDSMPAEESDSAANINGDNGEEM
ncbi:MAG: carbamoyltransferase N-terminal domain-containing protein [Candidatus Bruticola sp.]